MKKTECRWKDLIDRGIALKGCTDHAAYAFWKADVCERAYYATRPRASKKGERKDRAHFAEIDDVFWRGETNNESPLPMNRAKARDKVVATLIEWCREEGTPVEEEPPAKSPKK